MIFLLSEIRLTGESDGCQNRSSGVAWLNRRREWLASVTKDWLDGWAEWDASGFPQRKKPVSFPTVRQAPRIPFQALSCSGRHNRDGRTLSLRPLQEGAFRH